jgi:hypothetical protein
MVCKRYFFAYEIKRRAIEAKARISPFDWIRFQLRPLKIHLIPCAKWYKTKNASLLEGLHFPVDYNRNISSYRHSSLYSKRQRNL